MRFYSNPSQFMSSMIKDLGAALDTTITDKMKTTVGKSPVHIAYSIGDIDPIGYNDRGQEKQEIEIELQVYVSDAVGEEPQAFNAALTSRIAGLLRLNQYGLKGQAELPKILGNHAINLSKHEQLKSYCLRSIIFTQVVFVGEGIPELWEYEGFELTPSLEVAPCHSN